MLLRECASNRMISDVGCGVKPVGNDRNRPTAEVHEQGLRPEGQCLRHLHITFFITPPSFLNFDSDSGVFRAPCLSRSAPYALVCLTASLLGSIGGSPAVQSQAARKTRSVLGRWAQGATPIDAMTATQRSDPNVRASAVRRATSARRR